MMPFSPKPPMNLQPKPIGLSKVHHIALGGIHFVPDKSGALYAPAFKSLLIADLHLEQGTSLARRGIAVPPFDTAMTLATLEALLQTVTVQRLYFLGDSFHDKYAVERLGDETIIRLKAITSKFETLWIDGNHDPMAKSELGGTRAEEVNLGDIALRHEPQKRDAGRFEIAGHLHPGAGVAHRGTMVRGKCFVSDPTRIILPAFGAYTGGMSIHSKPFAGLFDRDQSRVHILARNAIHEFPMKRTS